jgi:dTDP-4-amino-4,6-dideoxygalactose transaminase
MKRMYRRLNRLGLVTGSSAEKVPSREMPCEYLKTMAPCQVRQALRELTRIEENIAHRTRLAAFYQRELPRIGFSTGCSIVPDRLPLLRYPVRVANKHEVLSLAQKMGVEIGNWFESPLHPAEVPAHDFGYCPGMCPEAELAGAQVVNLPTHLNVSQAVAERTLRFLRDYGVPLR